LISYQKSSDGLHLLVDSTGLKFLGEGEWKRKKHQPEYRRQWRKLHIGIDAKTLQIRAVQLTTNNVSDAQVLGNFHFPDDFADNPRVIQFRKMGWVDTYVEVIVNCSDEDIEVPKDGEVLFERHCIDTTLLTNGILIRKIVGNGDK
jgi:predicted secreted protein